ncbi:MAG: hypothetical protein ACLQMH_00360 [Solirubrobacteraceae bacterium]
MISTRRALLIRRAAVSAVTVGCAFLLASTTTLAATAIHFEPESLPALKGQLAHHEVHALTFHPAATEGHIHVSMNDGRHFTVVYSTSEQAALVALGRSDGARVLIAAAKPKAAAKPAHHKLRYIAAGILVVVIIVVAAVLLVDRRRKLGEAGEDDRAADGASVSPAAGEQSTPSAGEPT